MRPMNTAQQQTINAPLEPFSVHWAQTTAEIEEVQRLRYNVFADELGVKLQGEHGLDRDQFDAYSRHLYVRDNQTGEVVGTYRIITPDVAQKTGWYTQQEFDISDLLQSDEASTLMEVGRACVHKDFRNGSVVLLLWKATLNFAKENGYTIIMGCTSVPIGAHAPAIADVKELLKESGAFTERFHITQQHQLPLPSGGCPVAALKGGQRRVAFEQTAHHGQPPPASGPRPCIPEQISGNYLMRRGLAAQHTPK